ncbi:MAG TPA: trehalase family glycosidase [Actinomycetes bacterium]
MGATDDREGVRVREPIRGHRGRRPTTEAERRELAGGARAVLDRNWRGSSTVPSRSLYPHQWSWDAAFIAIGRCRVEQERAQRELESMFEAQWSTGMVPHIKFDPEVPAEAYFPGPDFWQSERCPASPRGVATSGITQPPLHARAALEIWRRAGDRREALEFLRRMYPKLAAQHAHLATNRDPDGHGLAAIVHPWESGQDNSPLWDSELDHLEIPPGALPSYQRRDLHHANAADRPTNHAYQRYVYLAMTYRERRYDDRAMVAEQLFCIEPPQFNAIYLWSELALAEIARLVGAEEGPHLAAAGRIRDGIVGRLWDPQRKRFFAHDARTRRRIHKASVDAASPLLDPALPEAMVEAIVAELRSPHFDPLGEVEHYLIPSYDLESADFSRRRYWRGPVWINTDWLVWRGLRQHGERKLAAEIEGSMIGLVERSGFREYYDPFTAQGYGSDDFSWTAALLLDVLGAQAEEPTA